LSIEDGEFKLLLTKEGRKKETFEEYRGYSVIRPYVYRNERGEKIERTMRFLVVESTRSLNQTESRYYNPAA